MSVVVITLTVLCATVNGCKRMNCVCRLMAITINCEHVSECNETTMRQSTEQWPSHMPLLPRLLTLCLPCTQPRRVCHGKKDQKLRQQLYSYYYYYLTYYCLFCSADRFFDSDREDRLTLS